MFLDETQDELFPGVNLLAGLLFRALVFLHILQFLPFEVGEPKKTLDRVKEDEAHIPSNGAKSQDVQQGSKTEQNLEVLLDWEDEHHVDYKQKAKLVGYCKPVHALGFQRHECYKPAGVAQLQGQKELNLAHLPLAKDQWEQAEDKSAEEKDRRIEHRVLVVEDLEGQSDLTVELKELLVELSVAPYFILVLQQPSHEDKGQDKHDCQN